MGPLSSLLRTLACTHAHAHACKKAPALTHAHTRAHARKKATAFTHTDTRDQGTSATPGAGWLLQQACHINRVPAPLAHREGSSCRGEDAPAWAVRASNDKCLCKSVKVQAWSCKHGMSAPAHLDLDDPSSRPTSTPRAALYPRPPTASPGGPCAHSQRRRQAIPRAGGADSKGHRSCARPVAAAQKTLRAAESRVGCGAEVGSIWVGLARGRVIDGRVGRLGGSQGGGCEALAGEWGWVHG